ncbi:MAG: hypothetical protein AAGA96_09345 [Verrucomicrobiota bacterium]
MGSKLNLAGMKLRNTFLILALVVVASASSSCTTVNSGSSGNSGGGNQSNPDWQDQLFRQTAY